MNTQYCKPNQNAQPVVHFFQERGSRMDKHHRKAQHSAGVQESAEQTLPKRQNARNVMPSALHNRFILHTGIR